MTLQPSRAARSTTGTVARTATTNLTWTGGSVRNIDMGNGTDTALLRGLPSTSLDVGELNSVSGGQGANDSLTFEGTNAVGPNRFTLWERVELTSNSSLTFAGGNLTLGDSGTSTGTLSIDSSSTLFAGGGQSSVVPFNSGSLVTVANAGTIDLTNSSTSTTDTSDDYRQLCRPRRPSCFCRRFSMRTVRRIGWSSRMAQAPARPAFL